MEYSAENRLNQARNALKSLAQTEISNVLSSERVILEAEAILLDLLNDVASPDFRQLMEDVELLSPKAALVYFHMLHTAAARVGWDDLGAYCAFMLIQVYKRRAKLMIEAGNLRGALQLYEEQLDWAHECGSPELEISIMINMGVVCEQLGELDAAGQRWRTALDLSDRIGGSQFDDQIKSNLAKL
jgi:tetratricopeptide (TPR) repeat protein